MSDQKPAPKEKDLFLDKSAAKLEEEERKVKKIKDYMPEIQAALPDILAPLEKDTSALDSVISALLPWERKARLAADAESAKLVAETILQSCFKYVCLFSPY
jgi:DNA topoisomerase VI subunit B